ncbi:PhoD-like phosphatase [Legionella santicrucis]|uniref:PhoD-like phosphatase n=1 Tax=Legionella santicrucis TaxID=45074 RepID=A0A0W0Y9I3_9GAMM|nr:alkaline phosphatase D family protein [Legionella santicrucis]KTD53252.1 PhoD-like phosphatase [Legionella santicrucis]
MERKPTIKNLLWAELDYIDCGDFEPAIEDDRVFLTTIVRLNGRNNPKNFQMRLRWIDEDGSEQEVFVDPYESLDEINPDNKKESFLHFRTPELLCKKDYQCDIFYKGSTLSVLKAPKGDYIPLTIETPPARQDPQSITIAVGGDQERHEQLGFLGQLFGINNYSHTKQIYKHIGSSQGYQLFIHLGDLFNGEVYFSLRNLFRSGRRVFERKVQTEEAFDYHLKADFLHPAKRYLAKLSHGFYNVCDDHDGGNNDQKEAITEQEKAARQYMENSFHKNVGLPRFSIQEHDGYGNVKTSGRAGPFFKKRIGQSEFFILHNRLTQTTDAKPESFLLGEKQWEWLEQSLAESKASNKIIISPLPFVMGKNPGEDYRAHWQEWHRFIQLCRKYKVGTILTADSHNFSESEIHVSNADDPNDKNRWIIHQHLIGTLGGSAQHITDEENERINTPGRPLLLPQDNDFPKELYQGSRVISYFSPGSKQALISSRHSGDATNRVDGQEETLIDSQWTQKNEWRKHTHGYARFVFTPQSHYVAEEIEIGANEVISSNRQSVRLSPEQLDAWQVKMSFFACNRKQSITNELRLESKYINSIC